MSSAAGGATSVHHRSMSRVSMVVGLIASLVVAGELPPHAQPSGTSRPRTQKWTTSPQCCHVTEPLSCSEAASQNLCQFSKKLMEACPKSCKACTPCIESPDRHHDSPPPLAAGMPLAAVPVGSHPLPTSAASPTGSSPSSATVVLAATTQSPLQPPPCCDAGRGTLEPGRAGRCHRMALAGRCGIRAWPTLCPVACGRCTVCPGHPQYEGYSTLLSTTVHGGAVHVGARRGEGEA